MDSKERLTHGIWSALAGVGVIIASATTYVVRDIAPIEVMDRVQTERIIGNELLILKNEQLVDEKAKLRESMTRDMRITDTERLTKRNEKRIEVVEEQYTEQRELSEEILREVRKP